MTSESSDPPGEAVPFREIFGEEGIPTDVMPNFAVVIRGYERHQVDGYVAELLTALEETRANLEDTETRLAELGDQAGELSATVTRHQALPAFADLGDHISTMMATAAEESETMRRRAEAEALETVKRAQEQSNATLRAADERATDVRAKAARLQAETLVAQQRALDDATREAAAIVADGERRRRETIAAAEALLAAATEEVTRIRATRDLGAEALEELSAVLARVAAEARRRWQASEGAPPADTAPKPAGPAAADRPKPDAKAAPVPRPDPSAERSPAGAEPPADPPRPPEPAGAGRPAGGGATATAPDPADRRHRRRHRDADRPRRRARPAGWGQRPGREGPVADPPGALSHPPRALALVGPSAAGKSALALELARAAGDLEIVSVDSMQVYRGMDVGTAKPTPEERAAVPHHLLDLADPGEDFSVAEFQAAAQAALAGIAARGRRALLVGGTGLYLRAVVDDLRLPGRYPEVRADLESEADTPALHARLALLDPPAARRMEPSNRRRVVRALEVTLGSGRPFSTFGPGLDAYPPTPVLQIGLRPPADLLDRRIEARVHAMVAGGFLEEVRRLPRPLSRTAGQALGYRELLAHLDGRLSLEQALADTIVRTRQLARRQLRWFRRDPRVLWWDTGSRPPAALGDWRRCA